MSTSTLWDVSVIIPVHNEEGNILSLIASIKEALSAYRYEIIFIDDGSTDNTVRTIFSLLEDTITLIQFSRNFGQSSAMAAGIDAAKGTYIATLDGDMQNDPADIPAMIALLEKEKLDIVAGKREKRQDSFLWRKVPSYLANRLIHFLTKIHVQDYGCTLKIFKAELAKNLDLQGELHRFIPILAAMQGARMGEMNVRHAARYSGVTKYSSIGRTFRVVSDLLLMLFFLKYRQKPMHFFGLLGFGSFALGSIIEIYLIILKCLGENVGGRPLFYVGIVCIIASIQFITTGFISELLMRTYHAAEGKKPYRIIHSYRGNRKNDDS